ncbi:MULTISPECIES: hypothetical protein [unclassified Lentimicrobium]|uniref:hypothetical protein n=1 Tax=unclassified Lentimicrobium TaxID=2677434 RepID=UPI001558094A|nr:MULTISPECIES: hypothetical protein [unclassified Lentimicrobium]NPD46127.1 hypothetical protein [Lentimicrobium sp. S6]NPD86477.1 hypothetical protein [Lentimicrobium sp. L6]
MQIKKLKVHGSISMLLFFACIGIADYALFNYSKILGLIYLMIVIVGFSFIALTYCTKCPIRERCNHLILGFVSKLREYNYNSYTNLDIISTLFAVLVIAFPQYWMFESFYLFLIFWILMLIAGVEIFFVVCSKCGNKKCALCRVDCEKYD